ncbi:nitrogen fixation protein FixH [Lysobacteraceae bacterium NML120232]|nr:nitrogen fixation protein FixH [Xanthomonadaceae bacterium NML08-0793]PJK12061.1 nitrogen fixation protein FixH [Xanthomonadaceae bacterium NML120232]
MSQREEKSRREPMLWLVVGLPLVVVVASFITLYLAITSGEVAESRDEVQRLGRVLQETDLGPDEQAAALGLTALLREREGKVEIVPMAGRWQRQNPLRLLVEHPVDSSKDRTLEMTPQPGGTWLSSADFETERNNDWKFSLGDTDGTWRLRGRMPKEQLSAVLTPAVGEAAAAPETASATGAQ